MCFSLCCSTSGGVVCCTQSIQSGSSRRANDQRRQGNGIPDRANHRWPTQLQTYSGWYCAFNWWHSWGKKRVLYSVGGFPHWDFQGSSNGAVFCFHATENHDKWFVESCCLRSVFRWSFDKCLWRVSELTVVQCRHFQPSLIRAVFLDDI